MSGEVIKCKKGNGISLISRVTHTDIRYFCDFVNCDGVECHECVFDDMHEKHGSISYFDAEEIFMDEVEEREIKKEKEDEMEIVQKQITLTSMENENKTIELVCFMNTLMKHYEKEDIDIESVLTFVTDMAM